MMLGRTASGDTGFGGDKSFLGFFTILLLFCCPLAMVFPGWLEGLDYAAWQRLVDSVRRSGIRESMNSTLPLSPEQATAATVPPPTLIHWEHKGVHHEALWRSERGAAVPKRVVMADDTLAADTAYRLACEGTGLLWCGDFHNARQLLQALTRRLDKPKAASKQQQRAALKAGTTLQAQAGDTVPAGQAFHLHRQAQAHW